MASDRPYNVVELFYAVVLMGLLGWVSAFGSSLFADRMTFPDRTVVPDVYTTLEATLMMSSAFTVVVGIPFLWVLMRYNISRTKAGICGSLLGLVACLLILVMAPDWGGPSSLSAFAVFLIPCSFFSALAIQWIIGPGRFYGR